MGIIKETIQHVMEVTIYAIASMAKVVLIVVNHRYVDFLFTLMKKLQWLLLIFGEGGK